MHRLLIFSAFLFSGLALADGSVVKYTYESPAKPKFTCDHHDQVFYKSWGFKVTTQNGQKYINLCGSDGGSVDCLPGKGNAFAIGTPVTVSATDSNKVTMTFNFVVTQQSMQSFTMQNLKTVVDPDSDPHTCVFSSALTFGKAGKGAN